MRRSLILVDHSAGDIPEAVGYVRELLDGFGADWFLCGGWAADARCAPGIRGLSTSGSDSGVPGT
jgi:hypothetical protein